MKKKHAIILYNLGSPKNKKSFSIFSFLFNLFNDKNIINIKQPFRSILSFLISITRLSKSKLIYKDIDLTLLPITNEQKKSLLSVIRAKNPNIKYNIYISMRYSPPRMKNIVENLKSFNPDKVIHIPLYPQYSTTTTYSSFLEYQKYSKKLNLNNRYICCFFDNLKFIKAHIERIKYAMNSIHQTDNPMILFSAHSLPVHIIKSGDPYQYQIESSVSLIVKNFPGIEWRISYQSKVGRLEWLSPDTENCIKEFAKEKRPLILVPIAFVSENSETTYELDIEYKKLMDGNLYFRVPTLDISTDFIECLSDLIDDNYTYSDKCPKSCKKCWKKISN
ncbi:MAG: ferrochelatase [Candidatus Xenolissoclinum pacificiensis L6]|uniref:Ferrochelatase n=1 Tax=Candidatus Xenolissoclinum pacificiensis L6 TaxID=1401685 RepID=W2V2X3_9RICK|nr:MAG: ferrochelatase [Candidatus Xenolissoclinum pacificiensis L6]